ncbi:sugar transferase [Prochlorococcus sp. AH-716-O13]|nr:sugar transferase [Prochlorococcus sp. AH-716-O13]
MLRILDLLFSLIGLILFSPLMLLVYILIFVENKSPFFYQERIGRNKSKFILIKFRTMKLGTKSCATHLVESSRITYLGHILRKTKIDELPQLLNVLKGDMSLVGPRPCLPTQRELINLRDRYNLYVFVPGITGLAQIKKIDMSEPEILSETDYRMMKKLNIRYYFYYILMTLFGRGAGDRVKDNYY